MDAEVLKYGLAGVGLLAEAYVIRELWKDKKAKEQESKEKDEEIKRLNGLISASQEARRIDAVETAEKTTGLANNVVEAVKLLGDKIEEGEPAYRKVR